MRRIYKTKTKGGFGAVREVTDFVVKDPKNFFEIFLADGQPIFFSFTSYSFAQIEQRVLIEIF